MYLSGRELNLDAKLSHLIFKHRRKEISRSDIETWRSLHGNYYNDFYLEMYTGYKRPNPYPNPRPFKRGPAVMIQNPVNAYQIAYNRRIAAQRRRLAQRYGGSYGKYTQSHPGGEIKGIDITNATTPTTNTLVAWTLNSTPKISPLNLITIGSSAWNRIGRKVSLKSVRVRGFITTTGNANALTVPSYHRFLIIYDKQPNGALPVLGDIFLDQSSVAADSSVSLVTSGLNLNNRDRFEIIMDKQHVLGPITAGGANENAGFTDGDAFGCVDWFYKLKNRETHYKADSSPAVIGDISTGCLFMVTFANYAAGGECYAFNASIRLRYSDL